MRIVIDATPLLLRSAGVKTHVYQLIRSLRRLACDDTIGLFPLLQDPGECLHERSVLPLPQTLWRLGLLHTANCTGLDVLNWLGTRADVFHASHQFWNPPKSARLTATIYDMTCWVVPEMHTPANVRGAKRFAQRVILRADGLIAN